MQFFMYALLQYITERVQQMGILQLAGAYTFDSFLAFLPDKGRHVACLLLQW